MAIKTFVTIPPQRIADRGIAPLVACDCQDFADKSTYVEHVSAYCYSDADLTAVEALEVGAEHVDEQGWRWIRTFDCPDA